MGMIAPILTSSCARAGEASNAVPRTADVNKCRIVILFSAFGAGPAGRPCIMIVYYHTIWQAPSRETKGGAMSAALLLQSFVNALASGGLFALFGLSFGLIYSTT